MAYLLLVILFAFPQALACVMSVLLGWAVVFAVGAALIGNPASVCYAVGFVLLIWFMRATGGRG